MVQIGGRKGLSREERGVAPELAARGGARVDENDPQSAVQGGGGGSHTGRARAHHHEVTGLTHRRPPGRDGHARAGLHQAGTLPAQSVDGHQAVVADADPAEDPPGPSPARVVRQATRPEATSAAARVCPGTNGNGSPSTVNAVAVVTSAHLRW
ncbi:hypothetical protein Smic_85890 [Streptomyces microflavus]|uniref:Uncharacterized protein n=1 Tax=Streptomyces microflavus TaxID=1919 RepID=A0A7J0D5L3_STRMI|nr:hypothetical protein Smic_85890 [Streptomyces microflavus]